MPNLIEIGQIKYSKIVRTEMLKENNPKFGSDLAFKKTFLG